MGEILIEKIGGKKGEGGKVFLDPLGGVVISLRPVDNLWDVLGL